MPVNIKGKEYKTVAERILELNSNTNGNYSIHTEILNDNIHEYVLMKATLTLPVEFGPTEETSEAFHCFTGHAYEVQGAGFINKTSHVENAETSAIGRALASAGYVGGTEFASADEVANAVKQQANPTPTRKTAANGASSTGIL
jgi:hypothetical protein|tara:strand:- start:1207 stop:1638 length:432 start_codon:yes stop_codon:yes gene_type:complete